MSGFHWSDMYNSEELNARHRLKIKLGKLRQNLKDVPLSEFSVGDLPVLLKIMQGYPATEHIQEPDLEKFKEYM